MADGGVEGVALFGGTERWDSVFLYGSDPPALWGDGCGCERRQFENGTWELELCPRHTEEYLTHGDRCHR